MAYGRGLVDCGAFADVHERQGRTIQAWVFVGSSAFSIHDGQPLTLLFCLTFASPFSSIQFKCLLCVQALPTRCLFAKAQQHSVRHTRWKLCSLDWLKSPCRLQRSGRPDQMAHVVKSSSLMKPWHCGAFSSSIARWFQGYCNAFRYDGSRRYRTWATWKSGCF